MFIWFAPALANGSRSISGFEHIRWTSKNNLVKGRMRFTTAGPKEMLGTKCPSIMSRWSQSAPERSTRAVSLARRPKSAASNDGAMIMEEGYEAIERLSNGEIAINLKSEPASPAPQVKKLNREWMPIKRD